MYRRAHPIANTLFFAGVSGLSFFCQLVGIAIAAYLFGWLLKERSGPWATTFPSDLSQSRLRHLARTLALIEAAGYHPTVVEYLKTCWTRPILKALFAVMNAKPRDLLREKGTPATELGLLDPSVSDDHILDAMVVNPILVHRPIVVTPKGTELSRPSEVVLDLLERKPGSFAKEDGEVVPINR
jgi:arsenate reductase